MFVVVGSTGEYSDRQEWFVAAYDSEAKAQQHVLALDAWLRANRLHQDDDVDYLSADSRGVVCPLDQSFSCDYTGTRYHVDPVEVRDQPPVYEPLMVPLA